MKKIALIDNFLHIDSFIKNKYEDASIEEILNATGGNTGNVAFVYAIEKMLKDDVTKINWGWDPQIIRKNFDQIVICAANQIGEHVDLNVWADKLETIGLPIVMIGLGAQSSTSDVMPTVPEGSIRFLKTVSRLSVGGKNISVRGGFTRAVLEQFEVPSMIGGCPSLLISKNRKLGKNIFIGQKKHPEKIAVAAGNIWHQQSSWIEKVLVDIIDSYNGAYVLQHPLLMMKILTNELSGVDDKDIDIVIERYGDKYSREELLEWMRYNAYLFVDVPNWMRFLGHYDLVLGSRYHGVALGVQQGIPGMVFEIDSRTVELSKETGIKSVPVDKLMGKKPTDIVEEALWTEDESIKFDNNRLEKARKMTEFLRSNEIQPSDHLLSLV